MPTREDGATRKRLKEAEKHPISSQHLTLQAENPRRDEADKALHRPLLVDDNRDRMASSSSLYRPIIAASVDRSNAGRVSNGVISARETRAMKRMSCCWGASAATPSSYLQTQRQQPTVGRGGGSSMKETVSVSDLGTKGSTAADFEPLRRMVPKQHHGSDAVMMADGKVCGGSSKASFRGGVRDPTGSQRGGVMCGASCVGDPIGAAAAGMGCCFTTCLPRSSESRGMASDKIKR